MVAKCEACGGRNIHHSRLRNWAERVRFRLTSRVPFRCHDCDWRGWRADTAARRRRTPDITERILHRSVSDDEVNQLDDGGPGSLG